MALPEHAKTAVAKGKTRKRAMSMASGMSKKPLQLSPRSKRRSLGPPKGILKSRINHLDDPANAPSFSTDFTLHNIQNFLVETQTQDGDSTRRSLNSFSRRVSFAPTANVRTFNISRDANTNSTESPSSPSTSDGHPTPPKTAESSKVRSITPRLSTQSLDGEQSMELDDDEGFDQTRLVDATEVFGPGIFSRRPSLPAPSVSNKLADRVSATPAAEISDETHVVGMPLRPPRPPSQAYLDLQDIVSQAFGGEQSGSGLAEAIPMKEDASCDISLQSKSDADINEDETVDFRTTRFSLPSRHSEPLFKQEGEPVSICFSGGDDMSISHTSYEASAIMETSILPEIQMVNDETETVSTPHPGWGDTPSVFLNLVPNGAMDGHLSTTIRTDASHSANTQHPSGVLLELPPSSSPQFKDHQKLDDKPNSSNSGRLLKAQTLGEQETRKQPHSSHPTPRVMPSPSPVRAGRVRRSSIMQASFAPSGDISNQNLAEEPAPITLEAFFAITGIRRDSGEGQVEAGCSGFFMACNVYIPQLQIYSWVASELRRWIEETKLIQRTAEDEVSKVTPAQFTAYTEAGEEDRAEYTSFLKLVKACEQLRARLTWYHWKNDWVAQSQDDVEKALEALRLDMDSLGHSIATSSETAAHLRDYHHHIMAELAREEQIVAEIEQSNPDVLQQLKDTISEQRGLVEEYQSRALEARATLESLDERLAHLETQRSDTRRAIESIRKRTILQTGSSKAGVLQLEERLDFLKDLHLWRIAQVNERVLKLTYGSTFAIELTFRPQRPALLQVKLPDEARCREKLESFVIPPDMVARLIEHEVASRISNMDDFTKISNLYNDCWASLSQVEAQLVLLAARFPLRLHLTPNEDLEVTITLLFHQRQSKALLSLKFSKEVLFEWPSRVKELQTSFKEIYGSVSTSKIMQTIEKSLSSISISNGHACLYDICLAAIAC